MAFANVTPEPPIDGIAYATDVPVVSAEAALGDAAEVPANIPIAEGQTIVAVVQLSVNGHVGANNSYIFLQTDMGDGIWVDVAWCRYTNTDAPQTFVLCGGGLGAMNNAFGPLRNSGSAPATQANGSNAMPLGGRCRFTGFSNFHSGSSSVAGVTTAVIATIKYKIQDPR